MRKIVFPILAVLVVAGFVYIAWMRIPPIPLHIQGNNASTLKQYIDPNFGFSFAYPTDYLLDVQGNVGDGHRGHYVIVLMEDNETTQAFREGHLQNTEGPPAISVDIFQNLEGYDALTWVKGSSDSNYKLGGQVFGTATIAGIPAITYRASGLYESNNVVFVQGDSIYKLSVGWNTSEDKMVKDFNGIVSSLAFQ